MRDRRLVLLLLLLGTVISVWAWRQSGLRGQGRAALVGPDGVDPEVVRQFVALEAQERQMDQTVWAPERLAERHGLVFDQLWDAVNAAPDKLGAVAEFPVPELRIPAWGGTETLPHGIELRRPTGPGERWPAAAWQSFLGQIRANGWRLETLEFRHNQFDPETSSGRAHSRIWLSVNLTRASTGERGALRGDVEVTWNAAPSPEADPGVERVDASALEWCARRGPVAFPLAFEDRIAPPEGSFFIDPLLVEDLDRDGTPEVALAAANRVYSRQADGSYTWRPLCDVAPGLLFTAVLGDFDGDGQVDLLGATFDGLVLFRGAAGGRFPGPGEAVWAATPRLKYAQVLTCGDVDRDGDLDVWLGQYKGPYTSGQMPTPYYDANDGYLSWLLLNDGQGRFNDATEPAGLEAKRLRRTYSGSWVDGDADGDLDLIVVSDFAGLEAYINDGRGRFIDRTADWMPERHLFGMAHTLADFDGDGRLDLLAMGMHCPTAQRLDHLKLVRPGFAALDAMRGLAASGNRLFRGKPGGGFAPTPLNGSIARSGWSWGCTAFDWDNDGWADVFIANGHESKQTVRDYEPEFWLHDIYVANSRDNLVANAYFRSVGARTRGRGWSYGGYEKNRLFWNRGGTNFVEIGHALGVALEADSRNAVSADFDGDGRVDLAVTTFEVWPEVKQTLKIYRNALPETGHWIGVRLHAAALASSPVGAVVRLSGAGEGSRVRPIVTGDSHRSQHPAVAHFGLGSRDAAPRVRVDWPDGTATEVAAPPVDRYLEVRSAPAVRP